MSRAVLALVVSFGLLGLAACPPQAAPCSIGDVTMIAHGTECAARVKACGDDGECKALVRDECNKWGDERCGFAQAAGSHG